MQRVAIAPRPNWQGIVESQGFLFHSTPDCYWDESAYYAFTGREIDTLESATATLHKMCLAAVDYVIDHSLFDLFGVPAQFIPWIVESWRDEWDTVYGRFDFSYDGAGPPKMLEYNADTPTALLEAAVIQWYWLQDIEPNADQFNSIHEKLIALWQALGAVINGVLYFSSVTDSLEDYITVNYLRDTAMQSGLSTSYLKMDAIGWHAQRKQFVDLQSKPIAYLFKLYPWEWMLREEFGPHLLETTVGWFEPPWKMLLSNKAILAILWEMYPDHPNLLRTQFEPFGESYVRKPIHSREGANIQVMWEGKSLIETEGPYEGPFVYQDVCPLPKIDGQFPAIGSWIVGDEACGIGIRESPDLITSNTSRFVPHLFK